MIRIATVTSLYPNAVMPNFGIFVENRLRHLIATGEVAAKVVAPVPWFPFRNACFGDYGKWAAVPRFEVRHGIEISHPRYLNLPKIGMTLAPFFMGRTIARELTKIKAGGFDFGLIDAHYFYPDGVAAAKAGQTLAKPVVITARGSDLNLIAGLKRPGRMIAWAAAQAAGLITVSAALKDKLLQMGIPPARVKVLRNGVDLKAFALGDKTALRKSLGLSGHILLSVGNLVALKGHDLTIAALVDMPDTCLLIAGSGPEEMTLKKLALAKGVAGRVTFLGRIPHQNLAPYYGAADALVLASAREGMANVLLEAMASGTPVVAADIAGMNEVVGPPESGLLMAARTPEALADAALKLKANPPDRAATRAYAETFSWDNTSLGQIDLFRQILGEL